MDKPPKNYLVMQSDTEHDSWEWQLINTLTCDKNNTLERDGFPTKAAAIADAHLHNNWRQHD